MIETTSQSKLSTKSGCGAFLVAGLFGIIIWGGIIMLVSILAT